MADLLREALGVCAYVLPAALAYTAVVIVRGERERRRWPQLAAGSDAAWPVDNQWRADAAFVDPRLVTAERRVRGAGETGTQTQIGGRAAGRRVAGVTHGADERRCTVGVVTVVGNTGGQLVTFICAECYEDFTLDSSRMGDTLTCPECLHVGKRPQDNFLSQVSETKGREKKILLIAAIVGVEIAR